MRLVVTGCDCRISGSALRLVRGEGVAPAHGLEEVRHAVGIETGRGEEAHADAIGFVLVGAREVDLLLHGGARGHRDTAECGVGRTRGRAYQDGREYGRHGRYALPSLRMDAARDVPLGDVRDFVGEHAGQLGFVAGGKHQPVVHADESARQRKRVDGVVIHEEERETLRRITRGLRDDARPQRLKVFGGLGVFDDLPFVAQLAHDLKADVIFVVEREGRRGGTADVGQIVAGRLRERLQRQQHRQQCDSEFFQTGWHRGIGPGVRSLSFRAYQTRNPRGGSVRREPG